VVKTRVYAVVMALRAPSGVVGASVVADGYCEQLVTAIRRMAGADAVREEPAL
jgi:hypothetical protein